MTISTRDWITGEEYAAERRRLIEAGLHADAPEWQALERRIDERNNYIFEIYGRPLIETHRGKWAAISIDGEAIIVDRELDAIRQGRERFGAANFCLTRLDDARGHVLYSPRSR